MWSLDNLHVLQIHSCDQRILGQFTCKAETSLGEDIESVTISEEFVEKQILKELESEKKANNVRRNVAQHKALPLITSSASPYSFSFLLVPSFVLSLYL